MQRMMSESPGSVMDLNKKQNFHEKSEKVQQNTRFWLNFDVFFTFWCEILLFFFIFFEHDADTVVLTASGAELVVVTDLFLTKFQWKSWKIDAETRFFWRKSKKFDDFLYFFWKVWPILRTDIEVTFHVSVSVFLELFKNRFLKLDNAVNSPFLERTV